MPKAIREGIPDQTIDLVNTTSIGATALLDSHDTADTTKIHHLWRSKPDVVVWAKYDEIRHTDDQVDIEIDSGDIKTHPVTGTKYFRLKSPFIKVAHPEQLTLVPKKGDTLDGIPDQTIDSVESYDAGGANGNVILIKGKNGETITPFFRPASETYKKGDIISHAPFKAYVYLDGGTTVTKEPTTYKLLVNPFVVTPSLDDGSGGLVRDVDPNKTLVRYHGVKRLSSAESTRDKEKMIVTLIFPKD